MSANSKPVKNLIKIRAKGEWACFTRPEFKAERLSYEVPTPSAIRGMLQSVTWKPEVNWHIHQIKVIAPIRWQSLRRNEVTAKAAKEPIIIQEKRTQRHTLCLRDVDYVITASMAVMPHATEGVEKYLNIARHRLEIGQYFQKPWFGCREMATDDIRLVEGDEPTPIDVGITRPLGWMLFDFDYTDPENPMPLYFDAVLQDGVIEVPSLSSVLERNRRGVL